MDQFGMLQKGTKLHMDGNHCYMEKNYLVKDTNVVLAMDQNSETLLSDPWLPTIPPRSPLLLPYTNPTLKVDCLINKETKQWNLEVLEDLIEQHDHHLIKKIFLGSCDSNDNKIWPYTTHGNYTARSGYHFSVTRNDPSQERPPLYSHPYVSKAIWNADVVPKLKHFLWIVFLRKLLELLKTCYGGTFR